MNWNITVTNEPPQAGDPEFTRCFDWRAESDAGTLLYGYDLSSADSAMEDARSAIRSEGGKP